MPSALSTYNHKEYTKITAWVFYIAKTQEKVLWALEYADNLRHMARFVKPRTEKIKRLRYQSTHGHKELTLNELMDDLEDPDNFPLPPSGISINIFPPKGKIVTDFGEEDNVVIQNPPGAQLRAEAEYYILSDEESDGYKSEDNLPLSNFVTKNKKKTRSYKWEKDDIQNDFALHAQTISETEDDGLAVLNFSTYEYGRIAFFVKWERRFF
ncbi:hypothetical protein ILUMI_26765 [Ignelater luminosus]|uniref:Uncharacterized protein n=1 Tax=Ignelater luminosus TaxID=2038154 RepID=A0A8K0FVV1_IGNLU|nr:hypothetical protein ILUMI_26765 [Ignelater luminosus]